MLKLTQENTQKAIERCKQLRPRVRFIKDRCYVVYSANNSNVYHVRFAVDRGERFGQCECKAGENGFVCYHIAGAAACNIARKKMEKGLR
jgi:hypothetical protein